MAASKAPKRKRARSDAELASGLTIDRYVVPPVVESVLGLSSAPSSSSSSTFPSSAPSPPSSSASSSSSSASSSASPSRWNTLPLELLVLIADCEPSYRLLLPLSSTCRHFYELVHEESVTGVVESSNSLQDVSARASCWRAHPVVRVAVFPSNIVVDKLNFEAVMVRGASPASYVLTSLRNLPRLELLYCCRGGPHAANLHPLHFFKHLCSLVLSLGSEDAAKAENLASNLSTALVALPSLVDLTVLAAPIYSPLLGSSLRRLASDRLQHITISDARYEQLIAPEPQLGRRRRSSMQPPTYPNVQSVTLSSRTAQRFDQCTTKLSDIRRTFANANHVSLGKSARLDLRHLTEPADLQQLLDLDSLHVHFLELSVLQQPSATVAGCRLRCLILRWDNDIFSWRRPFIRAMLALTPHLEQLAIIGGRYLQRSSRFDLETERSVFDVTNPLPLLTYLQFTSALYVSDIEYLLSSTSPPAFAATLTHLELKVRWSDRQRAVALLPSLPILYPSLQRCRVGLETITRNFEENADEIRAWRAMWNRVVAQLGPEARAVDEVRVGRADVVWRPQLA